MKNFPKIFALCALLAAFALSAVKDDAVAQDLEPKADGPAYVPCYDMSGNTNGLWAIVCAYDGNGCVDHDPCD